MGDEVLLGGGHACCQTDRSQERTGCPDGDPCLLHCRTIPGRMVPVDMLARISHKDTVSQEVSLSRLLQDTGGIPPAISSRFTEIVQHC